LRGDIVDAIVQKMIRIGGAVKGVSKRVVQNPPLSCRARYQGTMASREKRRALLNDSLPAASAGSGPFLIAGYYN
jgi:hypothetical protein